MARRRERPARPRRTELTLEVAGLDRRALEAFRLELLRLSKARGFRITDFRVVEADRSR